MLQYDLNFFSCGRAVVRRMNGNSWLPAPAFRKVSIYHGHSAQRACALSSIIQLSRRVFCSITIQYVSQQGSMATRKSASNISRNATSSFHLCSTRRSLQRLAASIHQKVQTARPTPAPQERHATRRLANAHARELAHPRIPFLSRQDERRAEPCPRPRRRPCYLRGSGGGTAVPRGRTATRALLLVWWLPFFLLHRHRARIRCCIARGVIATRRFSRQGRRRHRRGE